MGSICAFRSVFALEEHDSSQIDPCAAGKSPQFVLPPASVAGLVVPGVEAELEDGGLDIVPLVLLFRVDVPHQLSRSHRFQLLRQEVPPLVLKPVSRVGNAKRPSLRPLGFIYLSGPRICYSDRVAVALVQPVAGLAALDAGEHAVERGACRAAAGGKAPEVRTGPKSLPEGRVGRGNSPLPAGRVGRGNTAPASRQPSPRESPAGRSGRRAETISCGSAAR